MNTPVSPRATPSWGQIERPGKAGSAVLPDLGHFAPEALPAFALRQQEVMLCRP